MTRMALFFLSLSCLSALADWKPFAPRSEIAPVCELKKGLHISSGGNEAAFGGWKREFTDIKGGENYRFTASFRTRNVEHPRRSVIARLEWQDERGKAVRPPDYAIDVGNDGGWTRMELITPAPEKARKVSVELALGFSKGSVTWDKVQILPES